MKEIFHICLTEMAEVKVNFTPAKRIKDKKVLTESGVDKLLESEDQENAWVAVGHKIYSWVQENNANCTICITEEKMEHDSEHVAQWEGKLK